MGSEGARFLFDGAREALRDVDGVSDCDSTRVVEVRPPDVELEGDEGADLTVVREEVEVDTAAREVRMEADLDLSVRFELVALRPLTTRGPVVAQECCKLHRREQAYLLPLL